jgi:hypothetical protein
VAAVDAAGGFSSRVRPCELALQAKIFEASHTYKLKGRDQYLTIIEENGQRYYKAYVAQRLDGKWTPLADTFDRLIDVVSSSANGSATSR